MASISPEATAKLRDVLEPMMAAQPGRLGYPDKISQSGFYPGTEEITKEEIDAITKLMETKKVAPENTRLRKLDHRDTSAR
jgi:dipeptidyl-peptidase-3